MRTQKTRRVFPILPVFLLFAVASTGTVLASDTCGLVLVKTLTEAAHAADEHTAVTHKYTKATLNRWQVWGNLYLAKHGHPYVPPKRTPHRAPDADAQEARFKLECDLPPVPTVDLANFDLLPPEELVPEGDNIELIPTQVATGDIPPRPVGSNIVGYPGGPVFFGPGGGTSTPPPAIILPPAVTPEPGSWLLLATGLAGVFAAAKFRPTQQLNELEIRAERPGST